MSDEKLSKRKSTNKMALSSNKKEILHCNTLALLCISINSLYVTLFGLKKIIRTLLQFLVFLRVLWLFNIFAISVIWMQLLNPTVMCPTHFTFLYSSPLIVSESSSFFSISTDTHVSLILMLQLMYLRRFWRLQLHLLTLIVKDVGMVSVLFVLFCLVSET